MPKERRCFKCRRLLEFREFSESCKEERIPSKTINLMWNCSNSFILHCCKCLKTLNKDTFEYVIALTQYKSKEFQYLKTKTKINIIGTIVKSENLLTLEPFL